ncbi:MAG: hypothetical protein ACI4JE_03000 [Ruminococcus sp.]
MELVVLPKGGKFVVQDKKSRLLYTVKKKAFGSRFILLDASEYNLYTLLQTDDGKKPAFKIILNEQTFMSLTCKSLFLDPTIEGEGNGMRFSLASQDRRNFRIIKNDAEVGSIKTLTAVSGDLHYEIEIENTAFDDYIPLFAIVIERAFGDINKNK